MIDVIVFGSLLGGSAVGSLLVSYIHIRRHSIKRWWVKQ